MLEEEKLISIMLWLFNIIVKNFIFKKEDLFIGIICFILVKIDKYVNYFMIFGIKKNYKNVNIYFKVLFERNF